MKKDLSTEARIVEAAKVIFHRKGMDGARMQDIADEAGINKALLHYYFRSKERLFGIILKEAVGHMIPRILELISKNEPLFEKIRHITDEYISFLSENPHLPLFVLNEIHRNPRNFFREYFKGQRAPAVMPFFNQVQDEVNKGNIKPVNPVQLLLNMISLCIFPFVAKPMIQTVTGVDDLSFNMLMEMRRREVAEFIIAGLKK